MWNTLQFILIVLGLLLVFLGNKYSIPYLLDSGIACLGLVSMVIGAEAMVTRRITIGRRRHGTRRTYTGTAAVLQGVQFIVLGFFLIVIAIILYLNLNPRALGVQIAQHPGIPLIVLGMVFLLQSIIAFVGTQENRSGSQATVMLEFVVLRTLPGVILLVLALGALGLGFFEIFAPAAFDAMGGSLLEALYSAR